MECHVAPGSDPKFIDLYPHRFHRVKVVEGEVEYRHGRECGTASTKRAMSMVVYNICVRAAPVVCRKCLHLQCLGLTVSFMAEKTGPEVLGRDGESGWEDPGAPVIPPELPQTEAFESSQSEFAASEATHKESGRKGTRGGRPVDPANLIGVPEPKARVFKSDSTNQHQRTKSFYNYWNGLPEWAKENTILYVYRDYPVLLFITRETTNPEPKDQEFNYIDKISGAEPLQDDADLLQRYGCGNYKLKFNAIVPGKPNRTLCTVYAVNLGGGDFKSNPPTDRRISDSKNVDMNNPNNTSYIAYLRGVGLLPNQIDAIRGENDMASIELAKEAQTTTSKLVDALVDRAKENKPVQDPNFMEKAVTGAMEVVKEGSKAAIKITQDANEYANRVREKADQAAPVAAATESPLVLALKIVELMKGGASSGDTEVVALRAQIDKLRDDQVAILRDELKSMREARTVSSSTNPFDYMKSGMEALRGMKSTIDEITGGNEKEASIAETAADAAGAPKWLVRFAPLLQQGMQLVDGFFRMRTAQNMPPGTYPQPRPVPGNYPQPQPQLGQYPQPVPTPGPQLVQTRHPLATLDPAQFTPELTQILSAIAIPLGAHLTEDINGTVFADWFMSGFGEGTHTQIVQFGVDNVVAALYSFPATLQAVQGFPVEKVQEFVAEFLNPQFEDDGAGVDGEGTVATPEPEKTPV